MTKYGDIVPFETAQITNNEIVPIELAQTPNVLFATGWSNHQLILSRCKTDAQRLFYMQQAASKGLAFFFKLWGTWGSDGIKRNKHANGKMLQGEIIQQMPPKAQIKFGFSLDFPYLCRQNKKTLRN